MNRGPDESTLPGTCPLCRSTVPMPPEPRRVGDVLAVLGNHFGAECVATVFTARPATPRAWPAVAPLPR